MKESSTQRRNSQKANIINVSSDEVITLKESSEANQEIKSSKRGGFLEFQDKKINTIKEENEDNESPINKTSFNKQKQSSKNIKKGLFSEIQDNKIHTIKEENENDKEVSNKSPGEKQSNSNNLDKELKTFERKGTKSSKLNSNELNKENKESSDKVNTNKIYLKSNSNRSQLNPLSGAKVNKSSKEIPFKKPTLKYNSPELDLSSNINQMRIFAQNKLKSEKSIEKVNIKEIAKEVKQPKDDPDAEEDDYQENKKIKVYSKYSDLVIGDRMSEDLKVELGIIPKNRNQNFNRKKNELLLNLDTANLDKKEKCTTRNRNNTSLIKFIPKKFKLDPTDENFLNEVKRLNATKIRKSYLLPSTSKHIEKSEEKPLMDLMHLTSISKENNNNLTVPNKKSRHNKISLAYMVKEQFNKIKIQNLVEPEKIIEVSQDKFIRNKSEYVLEFQELNREIGIIY